MDEYGEFSIMSITVSSPLVENGLKDKKISLYQSTSYPSKYIGFVLHSQEKDSPKDFAFSIDLDEHSVSSQFYRRNHTEFENLSQKLHDDSLTLQEWVEILKCETFTVHAVLKLLVEHINEMQTCKE